LFILSLFSWSHFFLGFIPLSTATLFISITLPFSLSPSHDLNIFILQLAPFLSLVPVLSVSFFSSFFWSLTPLVFVNSSRYSPRVCRRCYSFELLRISVYICASMQNSQPGKLTGRFVRGSGTPVRSSRKVRDMRGSQTLVDRSRMLGLFENGYVYSGRYRQLSRETGYGAKEVKKICENVISWTQFGEVKPESPPKEFLRLIRQRDRAPKTCRQPGDTS